MIDGSVEDAFMAGTRRFLPSVLLTLASLLLPAAGASAEPPELEQGVKIEANGEAIEVRVGHLVPVVVDLDEDGKKDLLVGQFLQGKIRYYRNVGSDEKPVFTEFEYVKAGGSDISVPAG
jgi:hypothetical protein